MITVTLGTIPYSFERAISWLNVLLEQDVITEPVFVQHGITNVSPIASHPLVETKSIVDLEELTERVNQSRLVISHAGQGSTSMLAAQQASFILLPRLSQYKEHVDDHQLFFARCVQQYGIQHCLNLKEVEQAILYPPPSFQGQLFSGGKLSEYLKERYSKKSYFQGLKRRWGIQTTSS